MVSEVANYDIRPQIVYTKVSNKMAYTNSAVPDQTAPDQGLYCFSI